MSARPGTCSQLSLQSAADRSQARYTGIYASSKSRKLYIVHMSRSPGAVTSFPCARAHAGADAVAARAGNAPDPSDLLLRLQLGKPFPNSLLLATSKLPSVYASKHFINLTNGLELAPLLQQLQLPFSVVRIRSTCLEQQLFEALALELDANLLLALALGHSCIIWDCGCRNMSNGAPRAVWYGIEFIRFALNRFWLGSSSPAHLRGYSVKADFEAACRKFHPSTKKRLRYYQRFLDPQVKLHGVRLAGVFSRTERDEDVQFYVGTAWKHCGASQYLCPPSEQLEAQSGMAAAQYGTGGQLWAEAHEACLQPAEHVPSQLVAKPVHTTGGATSFQAWGSSTDLEHQMCTASHLLSMDYEAYKLLIAHGMGMFMSGLSHPQFAELKSTGVL